MQKNGVVLWGRDSLGGVDARCGLRTALRTIRLVMWSNESRWGWCGDGEENGGNWGDGNSLIIFSF